MEPMTRDEAKAWIRRNWGMLAGTNKLGETLKRYFAKYGGQYPSAETVKEVKEMQPK